MEGWKERLLDERCKLYKKIIKLRVWLVGIIYGVELEKEQLQVMERYLIILDKRIGEWK